MVDQPVPRGPETGFGSSKVGICFNDCGTGIMGWIGRLLLAALVIAPAIPVQAAETCPGWRRPGGTKIVNGRPADLSLWPSLATLRLTKPGGQSTMFICGGSAVTRDYVLTAAHCFDDIVRRGDKLVSTAQNTRGWALDVVLGVADLENATEDHGYAIAEHRLHEGYQPGTASARGEDIALLRLSRPWGGPLANLSLDAAQDPTVPPGAILMVAGHGLTKGFPSGGRLEERKRGDGSRLRAGSFPLLHVDLPLVSTQVCAKRWPHNKVGAGQLCAGYDSPDAGKDSCNGDSGGPINAYDERGCPTQVGLVSWGTRRCGAPKAYGVYTRISHYAGWLRRQVPDIPQATTSAGRGNDLSATDFLGQVSGLLGGSTDRVVIGVRGGQVVKLGGTFAFEVSSEIAGRLIIIDVNAAGVATQIFPNQFVADASRSLIKAGETVLVPGPGYGFDYFRAAPPLGKGRLMALVVPPDFAMEHIVTAPVRAKGFVPERSATGYFLNLLHQIATSAGVMRAGGTSPVGRWAVTSAEYEIVK